MSPSEKQWTVAPAAPPSFFQTHASYPRVIAQMLFNRELHDTDAITRFLNPDYDRDVHDPFLFTNMRKAVDRIMTAIAKKERIIVHGDYDADGVCGAAVLCTTLRAMGADAGFFLPHREKDGYGLNENTIKLLANQGTNIIITTDCGVSNTVEVALANTLDIDVIITDHHQIPEVLPDAFAILHPKIESETYPDKTLSGGGVAFKFCQGLLHEHQAQGNETIDGVSHDGFAKWLLDLVAISTVADMVPLINESRALTHFGLMVLGKTKRLGLKTLMESAYVFTDGPKKTSITADTIGFRIAPRINATGRMDHANHALDLMLVNDGERARQLAETISQLNKDRQKLTEELTKAGKAYVTEHHTENDPILFVRGDGWRPGVVGLIASRLKDYYNKPVIVVGEANGTFVGSGRSIDQFHITNALAESSAALEKFGGHPQACGFSLKSKDHFDEFSSLMTAVATRELSDIEIVDELKLEATIHLDELSLELAHHIARFAPFGVGNPAPLFTSSSVVVIAASPLGKDKNHLKLLARQQDGKRVLKFIAFRCPEWIEQITKNDILDVVYEIGINEWNGRQELQLKLVDIKKTGEFTFE